MQLLHPDLQLGTILRFAQEAGAKVFGLECEVLAETESTQILAEENAKAGMAEGAIVVAESQSAGRGRRGFSWISPPGVNLYVSILFRPPWPLERASQIQFLAGVAMVTVLRRISGVAVDLKWPNDLCVGRRKLGGMLLSAAATDPKRLDSVVLGVGLNVNARQEDFDPGLQDRATSLFLERGQVLDRSILLGELLGEIERQYNRVKDQGFEPVRRAWKDLSCYVAAPEITLRDALVWPGKEITPLLSGRVLAIDEGGRLQVRLPDGREVLVVDAAPGWDAATPS